MDKDKSVQVKHIIVFEFHIVEAVRDVKVARAQLEAHIELCNDLTFAHFLEDELRTLLRKTSTKREFLQAQKREQTV